MFKLISILCFVFLLHLNTLSAQNFSTHQVKKGETVHGIASQYGVKISDIYAINPDAEQELKASTILIIPISKASKPVASITKELEGFKEHKTKKKETLYSISKLYEVTEDDLKKYNTHLYANTLKKGEVLKIPVFKPVNEDSKTANNVYTVQPKEGKWRVAYKFGITVQELENLNPEMGETLQEGQQVYVPNSGEPVKEVDEKYSYYTVLPKEGFYRLKIKLDVEQTELEALNPDLKATGLKEGMILKIPYTNKIYNTTETPKTKTNLESKITNFDTKHIAIMLPFRLDRINFDSIADVRNKVRKDPYLDASLDFYTGVLTALDSLKSLGISLKVDVYDTKYQVSEVSKIVAENNFKNVDAVIGPLTPETFQKAAEELQVYNVPIISPIGTNLKFYDNVFQSRPSDDLLKNKMVDYIKENSDDKNIIIISDTKNEAEANSIKQEFSNAIMVNSRKGKQGNDLNFLYAEDIRSHLKPGKNFVFLETQSNVFAANVTSVLASLNQNSTETDIILVTSNYNPVFEGDQVSKNHLSKLQFHYATVSKTYNNTEHRSFVKRYTETYNTSPSKRAVKGFDLTMDVVLRLVTAKNLYLSVKSAPLTAYIENKFAYKKRQFGGYYNDAIYIVKHENLEIVEVK